MRYLPFIPDSPALAIDALRVRLDGITFVVHSVAASCKCPVCGEVTSRIHSFYERRLADLPWHGTPVRILWRVRRLFCDNPRCDRQIFSERCIKFAATYARRTSRLNESLRALGVFCGGEAGSRLAEILGMSTSADTLLRIIRKSQPLSMVTPRVLGVDDWAICRGQHYGTILCDLERHCVVDLLPSRSAESFAEWLKAHLGVEIISRDRGDFYIRGAKEGAPDAMQVADRWHLLKNLRDSIVRILDRHSAEVQSAANTASDTVEPSSDGRDDCTPKKTPSNVRARRAQQNRESRVKRYGEVRELHEQGVSIREIARRLGMHRSTVSQFVNAGGFPERGRRTYNRGTDSYDDFLKRRWQEGCRNARQLTQELKNQGFKGSYYMVRRRVAAWRQFGNDGAKSSSLQTRHLRSRQVAWILLKPPEDKTPFEQEFTKVLDDNSPIIATVHCLAQQFHAMVKERKGANLDQWLDNARKSELRSFAKGLEADMAAVRAALKLEWSNGQTEGQVNRLKTLKRQMYGRANLDLLRLRLLADQTTQEVAI